MNDREYVSWCIAWHFASDDEYVNWHKDKSIKLLTEKISGKIAGYIIYRDEGTHIEGLRSGVIRTYRGKGISKKLYKRISALAKRRGKQYQTYCHIKNYASLNSHIKSGMKLYRFKNPWAFLKTDHQIG